MREQRSEPAQTKEPDGYVPCPKKCGRWKHRTLNLCWTCAAVEYKYTPLPQSIAQYPDWTPPGPSKATPKCQAPECRDFCGRHWKDPLVAAACLKFNYYAGVGPNWENRYCTEECVKRAADYLAPPVPGKPKAAVCGNNGCKTPHENVAQRWCVFTDGSRRVALEWSCEPCHLKDEEEFAELMMFESTGTPYAGPERLPKPKLLRDEGVESDCWEDCP